MGEPRADSVPGTCPSCGSDDPKVCLSVEGTAYPFNPGRLNACPSSFHAEQEASHGCTCEPTGECLHSMSGPTCKVTGCPPCQHPELDTDPRCSVHGEAVPTEQEAGEK